MWLAFSNTAVNTAQHLANIIINCSITYEFIYHRQITKMPMQTLNYACNATCHFNAHNISVMEQNLNYAWIMRPNAEKEGALHDR